MICRNAARIVGPDTVFPEFVQRGLHPDVVREIRRDHDRLIRRFRCAELDVRHKGLDGITFLNRQCQAAFVQVQQKDSFSDFDLFSNRDRTKVFADGTLNCDGVVEIRRAFGEDVNAAFLGGRDRKRISQNRPETIERSLIRAAAPGASSEISKSIMAPVAAETTAPDEKII